MSRIPREDKEKFINDIVKVYEKHGLSLAHEDSQGAFIIQEYKEDNIGWLRQTLIWDWEDFE